MGKNGYWSKLHDFTNKGNPGLVRRRTEEFELFLVGDYNPEELDRNKHRAYNSKYGFPEMEGE